MRARRKARNGFGRASGTGVPVCRSGGFTLIEVIAALVVFSVGVLMAVQLTGVLSLQMENAAVRSEMVVAVQARLDSLATLAYHEAPPGSTQDTVFLRGRPFLSKLTVTQVQARIRKLDVSMAPSVPPGPSYTASIYSHDQW